MRITESADHLGSGKKRDSSCRYPSVNTQQLLGKSDVLLIQHQDQQYQLRITKAGKLILTK